MGRAPYGVEMIFELGDRVDACMEYVMPLATLAKLAREYDLDLVRDSP